ncbi:hypothetical protein F4679DRAFT_583464 [Xylaria curta]|nr:hypothetical protein F4679DRAFT_583464 [Xylaria curta]
MPKHATSPNHLTRFAGVRATHANYSTETKAISIRESLGSGVVAQVPWVLKQTHLAPLPTLRATTRVTRLGERQGDGRLLLLLAGGVASAFRTGNARQFGRPIRAQGGLVPSSQEPINPRRRVLYTTLQSINHACRVLVSATTSSPTANGLPSHPDPGRGLEQPLLSLNVRPGEVERPKPASHLLEPGFDSQLLPSPQSHPAWANINQQS